MSFHHKPKLREPYPFTEKQIKLQEALKTHLDTLVKLNSDSYEDCLQALKVVIKLRDEFRDDNVRIMHADHFPEALAYVCRLDHADSAKNDGEEEAGMSRSLAEGLSEYRLYRECLISNAEDAYQLGLGASEAILTPRLVKALGHAFELFSDSFISDLTDVLHRLDIIAHEVLVAEGKAEVPDASPDLLDRVRFESMYGSWDATVFDKSKLFDPALPNRVVSTVSAIKRITDVALRRPLTESGLRTDTIRGAGAIAVAAAFREDPVRAKAVYRSEVGPSVVGMSEDFVRQGTAIYDKCRLAIACLTDIYPMSGLGKLQCAAAASEFIRLTDEIAAELSAYGRALAGDAGEVSEAGAVGS